MEMVLMFSVHGDHGSHLISIFCLSLWAQLVAYSSFDGRTLLLLSQKERGEGLSIQRGLSLWLEISMDPWLAREFPRNRNS